MKKVNVILLAITIISLLPQLSIAQLSGGEIMQKVYDLPSGDDTQGQLTMTLINKRGEERIRTLDQFIINQNEVEKKIMFFLSPSDVRGTSFMNWSYTDGKDDDQWIYLPALKRTKRISSGSKSDYFMGSDFTYDDLGDRHPSKDNHQLLKEELVDGQNCYVVESTPKNGDYMYSKTITWVMKDSFIGLKREFYDEDGELLKKLYVKEFKQINGFWTILHTEMHNVQKDHTTKMVFNDVKVNAGIQESKFTERSMTRGQ